MSRRYGLRRRFYLISSKRPHRFAVLILFPAQYRRPILRPDSSPSFRSLGHTRTPIGKGRLNCRPADADQIVRLGGRRKSDAHDGGKLQNPQHVDLHFLSCPSVRRMGAAKLFAPLLHNGWRPIRTFVIRPYCLILTLHPVLQSDHLNFAIMRNPRRPISDEVDRPVRLRFRRIDRHDGDVPNVAAGVERPDICQNSLSNIVGIQSCFRHASTLRREESIA